MREYLLNSENMLDPKQVAFLNESGQKTLLPCRWIHFNDKIKLAFFPDGCVPLAEAVRTASLDDACSLIKELLQEVHLLEGYPDLTLENMVWDTDAMYYEMDTGALRLLYLPVAADDEVRGGKIYVRRVYAIVEELLALTDDAETMVRQVNYQKEQSLGDWEKLSHALDKREVREPDAILLKGTGRYESQEYTIGHTEFQVGSDPGTAGLLLPDPDTIDAQHAVIGWNEISFFVMDLGSREGTWVNGTRIAPNTQIPIGPGSEVRFGLDVFLVE